MEERTFTIVGEGFSAKYRTRLFLSKAVRTLISWGGGLLKDEKTQQSVRLEIDEGFTGVIHVSHESTIRGGQRDERPLLVLVGKQVKRFTKGPVVVEDSRYEDVTLPGLVDREYEGFKTLPGDAVLEIVSRGRGKTTTFVPFFHEVGKQFTVDEGLEEFTKGESSSFYKRLFKRETIVFAATGLLKENLDIASFY